MDSIFIFPLFPLTLEVCIMVTHDKLVRAKLNMRDELSLNTSSVWLGEKWRKKLSQKYLGSFKCGFCF